MEEIERSNPSIVRRPAAFAAMLALAMRVDHAVRMGSTLLLAGMITLFCCSLGKAQTTQTIYSHTFNGSASAVTNQTAPTVANDYAGGASTAIWRDANNSATAPMAWANGIDGAGKDSLVLPFTPQNGYVYTLTVSVTFTGYPGTWIGTGFAQNYLYAASGHDRFDDTGSGSNTSPSGYGWAILTPPATTATSPTDAVQFFSAPSGTGTTVSSASFSGSTQYPQTHTLVITLDTTGAQWAISCTFDGQAVGSYTYSTNPTITAVGLTQNGVSPSSNIQWNSLLLQATGTRSTNAASAAVAFSGTPVPLNPTFLGLSYEKQALTTGFLSSTNAPLVKLFTLLGPGVLRIGGDSVDTTVWNSGTTPITPAEVDTFSGFAKALSKNWSVIYGINLESNTPANAADEAAYAANDLGSSLFGFEIGNEPDAYGSSWPYSTFLSSWGAEESAITTTVPGWDHGIGSGGWIVDGLDEGNSGSAKLSAWIDPFAAAEAGVVSLLTQHYYVGTSTGATMQTMLTPDSTLSATSQVLTPMVTNIVGAAAGNQSLGARITESGSYSQGGLLGISNSLGAALWSLDYMFEVAENGGKGVNFHGGGASPYSPITDDGTNITSVGPEFYAMKMFSLIPAGGRVVSSTVTLSPTGPNFTAYGVQGTNAAFSAVLDNKEVNDAVSVTVNLGTGVSGAQLISLTAPNLFDAAGMTLGGAAINTDGTWNGGVESVQPATNGQLTVTVPPTTAYLLIPQIAASAVTTTSLTAPSTTDLYGGASITFTATVAAPGATGVIPTGTVTFLDGTTTLGTGALDSTGTATFTISSLALGAYSVTAFYQGDGTALAGSTSNALNFTVTPKPTLLPSTTSLTISPSTLQQPANVTFTATVTPTSSTVTTTPTGTVNFMASGNVLGSGTLNSAGVATYTTASTALNTTSYSVTAVYSGDETFLGSTSTSVVLTVNPPTPSFTLTAAPTTLTITNGQTGTAMLTLVPTYGYSGTVTLNCGTLPANVMCNFTPATLTADGQNDVVQSALVISTSSVVASSLPGADGTRRNISMKALAFLFLPSGLLLWGFAKRGKRLGRYLPMLVLALLAVGFAGLSGCGNGLSAHNAATGTFPITVTAADSTGSPSQTLNLTVTIK